MSATIELALDGYTDLPPGRIANVVTYFEMRSLPTRKAQQPAGVVLRRVERPEIGWYRNLIRRIGEDWLWTSPLVTPDAELQASIAGPDTDMHVATRDAEEIGIIELHREGTDTEVKFFGLLPALVGRGLGRWLMEEALALGFGAGARRVWLHTCTFDHPGAVGFYTACGFRPFKLAIEVMADPRRNGTMRRSAAPHVALIDET